jgi:AcrR family transcriptional regulator
VDVFNVHDKVPSIPERMDGLGLAVGKSIRYRMDVSRGMKSRPLQLGRDEWVAAALTAIAEEGVAAATVEGLARRLGVTKGSFYWHFENQAALLEAALALWEARETEAVIEALATEATPRARLERLFRGTHGAGATAAVHVALSSAVAHPLVKPCLQRVSERRIGYVEQCLRELGMPRAEARARATLAYAAYVGFLHLRREAPEKLPSGRALEAYLSHVIATLLPRR